SRDQASAGRLSRRPGVDLMTRSGLPHGDDLVVAMTGASGAPYAVRLLHLLGRLGRTVHVSLSPSAVQVLREEVGVDVDLHAFDPAALGGSGPGRLRYHHYQDFTAGIASGSFPTGGLGIIPGSSSTLCATGGRR